MKYTLYETLYVWYLRNVIIITFFVMKLMKFCTATEPVINSPNLEFNHTPILNFAIRGRESRRRILRGLVISQDEAFVYTTKFVTEIYMIIVII